MSGDAQMQGILDGTDPFSADMLQFGLDMNGMQDQNNQDAQMLDMSPTADNAQDDAMIGDDDDDGPETDLQDGPTSVGAGPLPTSYGMQLTSGPGSTLTEFTKRRNWSQRVIEEIKDFLHILTPDGRFLYVSPSAQTLTGHDPQHLVGKLISEFTHPDDSSMFIREFNESIASGNPLRFFYRFRKPDNSYIIFESLGHPHLSSEASSFGPNCGSGFCRGFFMMARPYPTKNAGLLDSFLEHKIENERLKKRIADLKREEKEEMEGQQSQSQYGRTPMHPALSQTESQDTNPEQTPSYDTQNNASNPALTRQNLDEALAASRPDSINDKMARYEGATHIETIEMLTGLRYRDGERSKGISTGAQSPILVRGDAGIEILVDQDGRPQQASRYNGSSYGDLADKKKKLKVADEYVCTDCGTLDSPEWRKGPSGPKTLCNACGLRWAKKEKRIMQKTSPGGNSGPASSHATVTQGTPQPPQSSQAFTANS